MRLGLIFVVAIALNFSCTSAFSAYCKKNVTRRVEYLENGVKTSKLVSRISRVCCEGFQKQRGRCRPFCERGCTNSVCTAPNICSCKQGYKKLNDNRCGARCDNCKYGICVAPGMCVCYKGYTKNKFTKQCEPSCSKPCINGICSDPDFCQCNEGYRISPLDLFTCIKNATELSTTSLAETEMDVTSTTVEEWTTNNEFSEWYTSTTEDEEESSSIDNEETSSTMLVEMSATFEKGPKRLAQNIPRSARTMRLMAEPPKRQESTPKTETKDLMIQSSTTGEAKHDITRTMILKTEELGARYEWTSDAALESTTVEIDTSSIDIESTQYGAHSTSTEIDSTSTDNGSSSLSVVDSVPSEMGSKVSEVDSTSDEVELASTELETAATEKDVSSPVYPISTEIEPSSSIADSESTEISSSSDEMDPVSSEIDNYSQSASTSSATQDDKSDSTSDLTESFEYSATTVIVEDAPKRKDKSVVKGGIFSSNKNLFNAMLSALYAILIIIVVIAIVFLIWFLCSQFHYYEYNIDKMEKKKAVVKYTVDRNDLITAW